MTRVKPQRLSVIVTILFFKGARYVDTTVN